MTSTIMKEYSEWFDSRIRAQNKHVLLLMDNFSAHAAGLALLDLDLDNEAPEATLEEALPITLTHIKVK